MHIALWKIFAGETLGTMVLILLGNGVVSNVIYKRTAGSKGGWLLITFGWGFGVFLGVMVANIFKTGGAINPAVALANLIAKNITGVQFVIFVLSQLFGAMIGQCIVNIMYWPEIKTTEDASTSLKAHATSPIHQRSYFVNTFNEIVGTCLLITIAMFGISQFTGTSPTALYFVGPLTMALTVLVIGVSLGGMTGYAINPARDLGPRIVHWIMYQTIPVLKNRNKINSNFKYQLIPIFGPLTAACVIGGLTYA